MNLTPTRSTGFAFASGFSLIEVMVASAVLAIVLAILLGTLSTSMSLWRTTEAKLAADREGRAGELLIAQDLASAAMPASPELWPRLTNYGGMVFLQFLTKRPPEYQRTNDGNVGDVCFVEYFFAADDEEGLGGALWRNFYPSGWTYTNVLAEGAFPVPKDTNTTSLTNADLGQPATNPQVLSVFLLADSRNAVRGLKVYNEATTNDFVVLATNNPGYPGQLLPHDGNYTLSNPPAAIEVNFAAADPETLANPTLLDNESFRLRNAGYYSFRVRLPKREVLP